MIEPTTTPEALALLNRIDGNLRDGGEIYAQLWGSRTFYFSDKGNVTPAVAPLVRAGLVQRGDWYGLLHPKTANLTLTQAGRDALAAK